ncbi:MAG: hypothetical protein AB7I36_05045 [Rhodospirillaceae bacterium]
MNEKERLLKTLFEDPQREHVDIKFFRVGAEHAVSEERLCAEVNAALFVQSNNLAPKADLSEDFKQVEWATLAFPQ